MAFIAGVACTLASTPPVEAQRPLKPVGWTERMEGETLIYETPDGSGQISLRMHTGTDLDAIALELLAPDRPRLASPRGDTKQRDGEAVGRGYLRNDTKPWQMYQVFVHPHAAGGAVSMYSQYELSSLQAANEHQVVFDALAGLATAGDPLPRIAEALDTPIAPESEATPVESAPSGDDVSVGDPPPPSSNTPGLPVEAVVFDLDYLYGLGGAATPQYEPVYLLADGRACQCPTYAPDEVTEDVLRGIDAGRRGRWRSRGRGYVITYEDGSDPEEVDAELSLPVPLPSASALSGRYQAIGGGGNVALGGTVMAAEVEDLTFFGDGSFAQSNFSFGSTAFSTAWRKRGETGAWSLDGPTLTLQYRDGTTVRTSVYYSEKRGRRNDADPYGVLWIGGESFRKR